MNRIQLVGHFYRLYVYR